MTEVLGWHFSTGVLGYGDGRPVIAGMTHRVTGPVILCHHGLHAAVRALDALEYAPSGTSHAARVRLSGEIVCGSDKIVATERTYLVVTEVTQLLHEFACRCAEKSLSDHIKREWLAGRAARDAARDAARGAAWGAAWDAAWGAAWGASWDAARAKQNDLLESMLYGAMGLTS